MSRMDRKVVCATVIVAFTTLQAGLAGTSFFARRQCEQELRSEHERAINLGQQIDEAQSQKTEQPPKRSSRWQLLEEPDVASTMQVIQTLGDAAGITFDSVKAAQSNTVGKQSFQIAGRGSPEQVCDFVTRIEQDARLVVVEGGRLLPGGERRLAFELGLATYHAGAGK